MYPPIKASSCAPKEDGWVANVVLQGRLGEWFKITNSNYWTQDTEGKNSMHTEIQTIEHKESQKKKNVHI